MLAASAAFVGLASFLPGAFAQVQAPAQKSQMVENCPGLVASSRPRATPAALRLALNADQVRFTYVGHSTFLIESPQLVRIATDYNDYVRSPILPDIVTMNHAHTQPFYRSSRSRHQIRAAGLGADPGPAGAP